MGLNDYKIWNKSSPTFLVFFFLSLQNPGKLLPVFFFSLPSEIFFLSCFQAQNFLFVFVYTKKFFFFYNNNNVNFTATTKYTNKYTRIGKLIYLKIVVWKVTQGIENKKNHKNSWRPNNTKKRKEKTKYKYIKFKPNKYTNSDKGKQK